MAGMDRSLLDLRALRGLLTRSDSLLEELERQNLAGDRLATASAAGRLDDLLSALPAGLRPSRPGTPTPTRALDTVFDAQSVLLRLLAAAQDGQRFMPAPREARLLIGA